jgi:3-dehydroquinate dehydratase type II
MRRVLIINGPNLDLLGVRNPAVYGDGTLSDLVASCTSWGQELGLEIRAYQSNHEGDLIDVLHDARDSFDGIVLNAGAYTHTSYAIRDAIDAVDLPTVEVHISNIAEREPWRRVSVIAPVCAATIYGRGIEGYRWALRKLLFDETTPPKLETYGDSRDHVGDLRTPGGESSESVVVLVHGGFWRHQWTRDVMDGLAVDLTARGFATWNVEYRRVGSGGGWPETVDDVALAIDHVTQRFGRVAVVGHSAGAHLALMASRRTPPSLVVSLAGVTDLVSAQRDGLGDDAVAAFMGGIEPQSASPLHLVPLGVPQLVVHGADDGTVPASYSRRYTAAARSAGDPANLLELPAVGHMELIDERSSAWTMVADKMMEEL